MLGGISEHLMPSDFSGFAASGGVVACMAAASFGGVAGVGMFGRLVARLAEKKFFKVFC